MADQNITIKLTIDGSGQLKKATTDTEKLAKAADKQAASNKKVGKSSEEVIKGQKGIHQSNLSSAKGFSKMNQMLNGGGGSSGLVAAYATLAANVFAATAAFNAFRQAAAFQQLGEGFTFMANQAGRTMDLVVERLKEVTGNALSTEQALQGASLAISAGFNTEDLDKLAKVARGASLALGRNLADAFDRLTRGAIKLEPEILDELGIMVRLDDATEKYAASIGKTANQLTQFQRQQAFVNAINEQGLEKYGELADAVDVNPYDKLAAAFSDLTKTGLNVLNKVLVPFVKLFAASGATMTGGLILFGSTILTTMIPALGNMAKTTAETAEHALMLADAQTAAVDAELEAAKTTLDTGKKRTKTVRDLSRAVKDGGDVQAQAIKTERNLKKQLVTAENKLKAVQKSGTAEQIAAAQARKAQIEAEIEATKRLKNADAGRLNQAIAAEAARTASAQARIVADAAAGISQAGVVGGFKLAAAAVRQYAASVGAASVSTGLFSGLLAKTTIGLGIARVAVKLFGMAFLNAIPVIGQVIFAIGLLVTAIGAIGKKFKQETEGMKMMSKVSEELEGKFDQLNSSITKLGDKATAGAIGIRTLKMSAGVFTEIAGAIALINKETDKVKAEKLEELQNLGLFGTRLATQRKGGDEALAELDEQTATKFAKRFQDRSFKSLKSTLSEIAEDSSLASFELQEELIKQFDAKFGQGSVAAKGGLQKFIRSLKPDQFDDVTEAVQKGSATINSYDASIRNLGRALSESEGVFSKFFSSVAQTTKFDGVVKQFQTFDDSIKELADRPEELEAKFEEMGTQLSAFKLPDEEIKDFIKRVPSLLLAFENIQEQARTLKGTLARLKSESEALSSAQAFGFFGSEAFLNKQRESIDAQLTFIEDQLTMYEGIKLTKDMEQEKTRLQEEQTKLMRERRTDMEIYLSSVVKELEFREKISKLESKIAQSTTTRALNEAKIRKLITAGTEKLSPSQQFKFEIKAAKDSLKMTKERVKLEKQILTAKAKLLIAEQAALVQQGLISKETALATLDAAKDLYDLQVKAGEEEVKTAESVNSLVAARGMASGDILTAAKAFQENTSTFIEGELPDGVGVLVATALNPMVEAFRKLGGEGESIAVAIERMQEFFVIMSTMKDTIKELTEAIESLGEMPDFLTSMGITPENLAKTIVRLQAVSGVLNTLGSLMTANTEMTVAAIDRQIEAEKKLDGNSKASIARIEAMEKKKTAVRRKAFEEDKKIKIAQAYIAGLTGAVQAFAALAWIPFIGPALGAAVAASIMALTQKNVSLIKASQFDGGGSTGGGTPQSLSIGNRNNMVDVSQATSSGELSYLRGESGMGSNANNFTPGGAAGMRRGYQTGGEILVGEQGPEIIQPTTSGFNVIPNDRLGSGTSNVNFTINAVDAAGVQEVLEAQRGNIIGMIREAAHAHGEEFIEAVDTSAYGEASGSIGGSGGYG